MAAPHHHMPLVISALILLRCFTVTFLQHLVCVILAWMLALEIRGKVTNGPCLTSQWIWMKNEVSDFIRYYQKGHLAIQKLCTNHLEIKWQLINPDLPGKGSSVCVCVCFSGLCYVTAI